MHERLECPFLRCYSVNHKVAWQEVGLFPVKMKTDWSYTDLKQAIEKAPLSFLPGLFMTVVKVALHKNVFKDEGMERLIGSVKRDLECGFTKWDS